MTLITFFLKRNSISSQLLLLKPELNLLKRVSRTRAFYISPSSMSPENILMTTETFFIINWFVIISARLGSTPFLLNPSSRRVSLNLSTPFIIFCWVNRIITSIYLIVLIYLTCVALNHYQGISMSLIVTMLLICIFFCIDLAVDYVFWKYAGDIEEQFNGFVVFIDRMNRTFQIHSLVCFKFIFAWFVFF